MQIAHRILFVCTGNSCRSIMAEAYLRKRLEEEHLPFEAKSAGILGMEGMAPTHETLEVLKEEGIEAVDCYVSKSLTKELVNWASVILVMERIHAGRILSLVPEAKGKIHFLSKFSEETQNQGTGFRGQGTSAKADIPIPDPIGKPLAYYRESFSFIKQSVEGLIKCLLEE